MKHLVSVIYRINNPFGTYDHITVKTNSQGQAQQRRVIALMEMSLVLWLIDEGNFRVLISQ